MSPSLDCLFCASIVFKDETANPIRSFKGCGANNLRDPDARLVEFVCHAAE